MLEDTQTDLRHHWRDFLRRSKSVWKFLNGLWLNSLADLICNYTLLIYTSLMMMIKCNLHTIYYVLVVCLLKIILVVFVICYHYNSVIWFQHTSKTNNKKKAWRSLKQIIAQEKSLAWPADAVLCKYILM